MKKIICIVALMFAIVGTTPVHAVEREISVSTTSVTRTLEVTPKLKVSKVPTIPQIKPKCNLNIDFSKYIPKITLS